MSGSTPGDPPTDSDGDDQRRDRRDSTVGDGSPPAGDSSGRSGTSTGSDEVTIENDGVVRWFLRSEDDTVVFVRDILSSVAIVAVIGLVLFGISGVWPPLVAVESGSMEPNMHRGDLIFVVDDERFVGDDPVEGTGVVTLENGQESGHEKFGNHGDVIVFRPDGNDHRTPVIHRAHFWVEEGENWVDTKADEEIIGGATCADVRTCPAPHDGFVTKGDANGGYDQYQDGARTNVVRPDWVTGKAMFRIPLLGHIRLTFDSIFNTVLAPSPTIGSGPGPATVEPLPESGGAESDGIELAGAAATSAAAGAGVAALAAGRRRR